jgi:hypothetical protein
MRNRRHIALRVEFLEGMTLLSGSAATVTAIAVPIISKEPLIPLKPQPPAMATFHGKVQGTYVSTDRIPDVGRSWTVSAKGKLSGLGETTVAGTLHSTGFILQGHAGGTLTLKDARGSMTLTLTGPPQSGFSGLPAKFSFVVTKATGHDRGQLNHTGTVAVSLIPGAAASGSPSTTQVGKITLTF